MTQRSYRDWPHRRGYAICDFLTIFFPILMCCIGMPNSLKLWNIRLNYSDREQELLWRSFWIRGASTSPWRVKFIHFYVLQTTETAVSSLFNGGSPISRGSRTSPLSPKMSWRLEPRPWHARVAFSGPKTLLGTIVRCLETTSCTPVCTQSRGGMCMRKIFDDGSQTERAWDNRERYEAKRGWTKSRAV